MSDSEGPSRKRLRSLYLVAAALTGFISVSICAGKEENNYVSSDKSLVRSKKNSNRFVTEGAGNPIFLQHDSGTILLGQPGTELTSEDRSIRLDQGKVFVLVGKRQLQLNAGCFQLQAPGGCAVIIQLKPDGQLRLSNLLGKPADIVFSVRDQRKTLTVEAGEEIYVATDESYDEEKLLPPDDGVYREPITCCVSTPGFKHSKIRFDQSEMVQKEELLSYGQLHSKRARQKIENLKLSVKSSSCLQPLKRH